MQMQSILETKGITKYFPGIRALNNVSIKVRTGEVHALIGENGAGKSTLIKIITGVYQPDGGEIILKGKKVAFKNPLDSQESGIAVIHQEATMFLERSVMENVFMGHHIKKRGLIDWKEMRSRTIGLLEKLELDLDPDTAVKNLSIAQRHMVEIVKALSFDVQVVIMDEPTSALTLKEVEDLYKIIRRLREEGKAVIFISHKFDEIKKIADYFTVLRDGEYIGEGKVSETSMDEIIKMMVGRDLKLLFPKKGSEQGDSVLEVEGLSREGEYENINFKLHEKEILGFFGLVGSGRSELMHSIFGINTPSKGVIKINNKKVMFHNAGDAMDKGIAYVPEDRQEQGAVVEMNINENITLPIIDSLSPSSFLNNKSQYEVTDKYGKLMEIKSAGWSQAVETLSGGNQQKVVLAKWLATNPKILILDEPTKGIDVATKAAVHRFMVELAEQGFALIMVSSELPEVLGMSDNIIIMREGRIVNKFSRNEASSEEIIKAATGNIAV
jgi:rhamnose transport system ATP-binding protein